MKRERFAYSIFIEVKAVARPLTSAFNDVGKLSRFKRDRIHEQNSFMSLAHINSKKKNCSDEGLIGA